MENGDDSDVRGSKESDLSKNMSNGDQSRRKREGSLESWGLSNYMGRMSKGVATIKKVSDCMG